MKTPCEDCCSTRISVSLIHHTFLKKGDGEFESTEFRVGGVVCIGKRGVHVMLLRHPLRCAFLPSPGCLLNTKGLLTSLVCAHSQFNRLELLTAKREPNTLPYPLPDVSIFLSPSLLSQTNLSRLSRTLSGTMCPRVSSRKPTPPQNRQLNIRISNNERYVHDFVGESAFWK